MPVRSKLPRRLSIKRRRDIDQVMQTGSYERSNQLAVKWQPADQFRYVLLVGRRHGNAVQRNRLKRLIREALRLNRYRLNREVRIAVLPAPTGQLPRFDAVNAEFSRLFERISRR